MTLPMQNASLHPITPALLSATRTIAVAARDRPDVTGFVRKQSRVAPVMGLRSLSVCERCSRADRCVALAAPGSGRVEPLRLTVALMTRRLGRSLAAGAGEGA